MDRPNAFALCLMFCTLYAAAGLSAARGEPEGLSFEFEEKWSGVFSGTEAVYHVTVASGENYRGRVGWRLVFKERTLSRGEAEVNVGPEKAASVEIRLPIPKAKEGVIIQAPLTVSLYGQGKQDADAELRKQVWIFTKDPFALQKEWVKGLKIKLFDPEKKTAELFEKVEIKCDRVHNVDSLADLEEGLLIIGEGVSFKEYRGLPAMMINVAAKGVPVLCLAPGGGLMTLPGAVESELPPPRSISLRRQEVIASLDKRLDSEAWPPEGKMVSHTLALLGERGPVVAEVMEEADQWPWLEIDFEEKKTKLVVCCFRIIRKWDSGPTPRYLLARLLERLKPTERRRVE